MTTADAIRAFIDESLLDEPHPGEDALADLDLDSLAIEQIIDFLEEEYGILFSDEELVRETFATVPVLAELVDRKRAAAA